jgi:hypothetical protein
MPELDINTLKVKKKKALILSELDRVEELRHDIIVPSGVILLSGAMSLHHDGVGARLKSGRRQGDQ